jgi:hypothetical protein
VVLLPAEEAELVLLSDDEADGLYSAASAQQGRWGRDDGGAFVDAAGDGGSAGTPELVAVYGGVQGVMWGGQEYAVQQGVW